MRTDRFARRAILVLAAVWIAGCPDEGGGPGGEGETPRSEPGAAGASAAAPHSRERGAGEDAAPGFVPCPVASSPAPADPDALLAEAGALYDRGRFSAALSCADRAADRLPRAVEGHHLRAAALAALGRHDAARTAFATALALDPDDPETLAAAADYYINVIPDHGSDATRLGLAYARRGSERAASRRRRDRRLRGRLLVLQAQASNDLGRPDRALEIVRRALDIDPGAVEALHERGVSLFNLCEFAEAEEAFRAVIERVSPDEGRDPYAHYHLGLIHERAGREREARRQFARARALSGGEIAAAVEISPAAFRREVEAALAALPPRQRRLLREIDVEIAAVPAVSDLTAVDPPLSPTILGLYRGLPHGDRWRGRDGGAGSGASGPPDRAIVLYRNNLARAATTREGVREQIRKTLQHEIGHLEGLSEADLLRRGLE